MQVRKNKYQRDHRGHIIEDTKEKEIYNGKGKNKAEAVLTKNKFDAREVEEIDQPTLRITYCKGENNDKAQQQLQQVNNMELTRVDQGEGEEQRRIKKEAVEKVLNNEKSNANKEKVLNHTTARNTSLNDNGIRLVQNRKFLILLEKGF